MELTLTKAEENVMKILWELERGLIRDIVDKYDEPKPAYTTVATICKILENKGFIGREKLANTHEYFPLIPKEQYSKKFMKSFLKKYFSNSMKGLVSAFSTNNELSIQEMQEIVEHLQAQIKNKKED